MATHFTSDRIAGWQSYNPGKCCLFRATWKRLPHWWNTSYTNHCRSGFRDKGDVLVDVDGVRPAGSILRKPVPPSIRVCHRWYNRCRAAQALAVEWNGIDHRICAMPVFVSVMAPKVAPEPAGRKPVTLPEETTVQGCINTAVADVQLTAVLVPPLQTLWLSGLLLTAARLMVRWR